MLGRTWRSLCFLFELESSHSGKFRPLARFCGGCFTPREPTADPR
jgi:hypothetical protein